MFIGSRHWIRQYASSSSRYRYSHLLNYLQAMHQGVIRDMEQQRIKRERQLDFEMQRQLEEEYRKVQHVSERTGGQVNAK